MYAHALTTDAEYADFHCFPVIRGKSKAFDIPITYFFFLSPSTALIRLQARVLDIFVTAWLSNTHFPSENFRK